MSCRNNRCNVIIISNNKIILYSQKCYIELHKYEYAIKYTEDRQKLRNKDEKILKMFKDGKLVQKKNCN